MDYTGDHCFTAVCINNFTNILPIHSYLQRGLETSLLNEGFVTSTVYSLTVTFQNRFFGLYT